MQTQIEGEGGKTCTGCHEWRKFSFFNSSKEGKFGYQSRCKVCRRAYNQDYARRRSSNGHVVNDVTYFPEFTGKNLVYDTATKTHSLNTHVMSIPEMKSFAIDPSIKVGTLRINPKQIAVVDVRELQVEVTMAIMSWNRNGYVEPVTYVFDKRECAALLAYYDEHTLSLDDELHYVNNISSLINQIGCVKASLDDARAMVQLYKNAHGEMLGRSECTCPLCEQANGVLDDGKDVSRETIPSGETHRPV